MKIKVVQKKISQATSHGQFHWCLVIGRGWINTTIELSLVLLPGKAQETKTNGWKLPAGTRRLNPLKPFPRAAQRRSCFTVLRLTYQESCKTIVKTLGQIMTHYTGLRNHFSVCPMARSFRTRQRTEYSEKYTAACIKNRSTVSQQPALIFQVCVFSCLHENFYTNIYKSIMHNSPKVKK